MAKLKAIVKLNIVAGNAKPTPPVGPALGQHGVQIMKFCTEFNERTKDMDGIVPALITIMDDNSFTFVLKTPPAASLILKTVGKEKGSANSIKEKIGSLTQAQLREIAEKKMPDLNANTVEQAMKIIAGTAKNMGVEIAK